MEIYPKFIIENDKLILMKVTFHSDIVTVKEKVMGGGVFRYLNETDTFLFSGTSHDFGPASFENIKKCVETGEVYSDKKLRRNISARHNFAYDTGTEIISLEPKMIQPFNSNDVKKDSILICCSGLAGRSVAHEVAAMSSKIGKDIIVISPDQVNDSNRKDVALVINADKDDVLKSGGMEELLKKSLSDIVQRDFNRSSTITLHQHVDYGLPENCSQRRARERKEDKMKNKRRPQ
jgi:hypothetical protein